MLLTSAAIANFRALDRVEIQLDNLATLIVGRNNSGKTSFVNLFEKFFGYDVKFVLEDFPATRIADIKTALRVFDESCTRREAGEIDEAEALLTEALKLLPQIQLTLTLKYTEDEDLAAISDLILDLDEDCFEAKIESTLALASPQGFL
ncbi:AAA family ATPase [Streptantibioticus ferralitis]|uniref:AAA family ATPase n=1 Tax=Streptantibioticus ferralitis TaxID=236510 RepID=A0ABT5Z9H8_9ACTN|nr:AAA family ATPase [Streptantibioticus ferralitis]MDF2260465.1 AAA family ATPase [Streptantibioticus ferralitis]